MANYRNISMAFWTDSKIVDDFTPEDRYIYLYCMTNPHTNLCGCYEVSIKQIANETGYNTDSVERLLTFGYGSQRYQVQRFQQGASDPQLVPL